MTHPQWRIPISRTALCFLVFVATVSGAIAGQPDSSICGKVITVDSTFKGCSVGRTVFTSPEQSMKWEIHPGKGVGLRVTLRSSTGAARLEVTPVTDNLYNPTLSEDTQHGPATVVISSDDLMLESKGDTLFRDHWDMSVHNAFGMTTWWLQVEAIPGTLRLAAEHKVALKSLFDECCDTEDIELSSTCNLLQEWSQGVTDASNDACQSSYTSCSPNGLLTELVLPGVMEVDSLRPGAMVTFKEKCLSNVPAGLQALTTLQLLDLQGHGLTWTTKQVTAMVAKMPGLQELYLGSNSITGPLDETTCSMFKGPLVTLSFRNIEDDNSYYNSISGAIAPCVFSKNLQALNLQGNQISAMPEIPAGSGLKFLRLGKQVDTADDGATLEGSIPASILNAKALTILDVSSNDLVGSIPPLPSNLQVLDLSDNMLEGKFPSTFTTMKQLMLLSLADNVDIDQDLAVSGLATLPQLSVVLLGNTGVSGDLNSVDWSQLDYLSALQLSAAKVGGIIPPSLATRPMLQLLDLSGNRGITSQADFARTLSLVNKINIYNVNNCSITDFPNDLQNLAVFQSNESFDSAVLSWAGWGKSFDISGNNITGVPIPSWLFAPFPALTSFRNGEVYFALQGQQPTNPTELENRMTCPDVSLSQKQLMISKQIFPQDAGAGPEAIVEGGGYGAGTGSSLYCIDYTGKSVLIGESLTMGPAVTNNTDPSTATHHVLPPVGDVTTASVNTTASDRAALAATSSARVTSYSEDKKKVGRGTIIGVAVVCILAALVMLGAAVYGVRRYYNRKVQPFSEFKDEVTAGAPKSALQLVNGKMKPGNQPGNVVDIPV